MRYDGSGRGAGTLVVFARAADGGLMQDTFDGGAWSIWAPVGRTGELIQGGAGACK